VSVPPTASLASGNKVVGSESAPLVTAALIVAALQDGWQLLVDHEAFWPLTPNIFTLAGFALFFGLRWLNTAAGSPLDVEVAKARRETATAIARDIRQKAADSTPVYLDDLAAAAERHGR
jgi:hypothetical protein